MTVSRDTSEDRTPAGPVHDLSTWLTVDEAAARAGVATKTIRRDAERGKIQSARRRSLDGGQERTVYNPEDVDRVAAEREPGPLAAFLVPGQTPSANGNGSHAAGLAPSTLRTSSPELVHALARVLLGVAEKAWTSTPPVSTMSTIEPGRYYTIEEVAIDKRLTTRGLWKRLRLAGIQPIRDDGQWKVRGSEATRL